MGSQGMNATTQRLTCALDRAGPIGQSWFYCHALPILRIIRARKLNAIDWQESVQLLKELLTKRESSSFQEAIVNATKR